MTSIDFSYSDLEKAHAKAVMVGEESFVFLGKRLYTRYAYYLLEHLLNMLKKNARKRTEKCFLLEGSDYDGGPSHLDVNLN